jgi:hypothetical protein
MAYRCVGCGSADSQHDWVNSQFGDYYCSRCLDGGGNLSRRADEKGQTSPLVLGVVFFLVTAIGLLVLFKFVLR